MKINGNRDSVMTYEEYLGTNKKNHEMDIAEKNICECLTYLLHPPTPSSFVSILTEDLNAETRYYVTNKTRDIIQLVLCSTYTRFKPSSIAHVAVKTAYHDINMEMPTWFVADEKEVKIIESIIKN